MKKTIYKNQLVSYIHALSGKSYKEARQICKVAKWKKSTAVAMALNYDELVGAITRVGNDLAQIINEMLETTQKILNNLGPTLQTTADSMKQSAGNMIQNDT